MAPKGLRFLNDFSEFPVENAPGTHT